MEDMAGSKRHGMRTSYCPFEKILKEAKITDSEIYKFSNNCIVKRNYRQLQVILQTSLA
jgi:hypothetical protein